jgi:hypothetical protein
MGKRLGRSIALCDDDVMLQHERKLPAEFDPSYRAEAEALFDTLLAEAGALVARHWAAIDRVAVE